MRFFFVFQLVSNLSTDAVSGAKVSSATFGYKDETGGQRS